MKRFLMLAGMVVVFLWVFFLSCATITGVSEEQKQDLRSKGFPIAVLEVKSGTPNSAGGVNAYVYWQNISDKEIKYVDFIVTPYNRVNDIAPSEIGNKSTARLKDTGPYKPGKVVSDGYYENMWYNHTIDHLTLDGVVVTFMDGTVATYDSIQVNQMYINMSKKTSNSASAPLSGDPSNTIIGTWEGGVGSLGDIKFEGNQFVMAEKEAGSSTVNSYIGTFSYDTSSEILVLNVTGGILGKKWLGEHTGKAVVDGDTLKCSEFDGDGAFAFNYFLFTKQN